MRYDNFDTIRYQIWHGCQSMRQMSQLPRIDCAEGRQNFLKAFCEKRGIIDSKVNALKIFRVGILMSDTAYPVEMK